ncbi:MAG TPA: MFS transporter [Gemmatimonadota bacterium]|nr:MFS transporter [Gemmatimonadota bacterium]
MPRFLERIGLGRPELRAWALYDWANSAWVLTIQTAVFPIYFKSVVAADLAQGVALQRYGWITSGALVLIAIAAPLLGALADFAGIRKRMLGVFLAIGAVATACLFFVQRGDWLMAALIFGAANIGAQGAFVFYDALLGHVARPDEVDRVSTAGYAVGYLGSAMLLALQLAWIASPGSFGLPSGEDLSPSAATLPHRLAFLSVAVWWVVFSIPLFLRVPEPPRRIEPDERPGQNPVRVAFVRLTETLRDLRSYRQAFLMLLAFVIYNDGIGTIIKMAALYAAELDIPVSAIALSILVAQVVGIPFAFLFGALAGRIGPKRSIQIGLVVYIAATIYAFFLDSSAEFFLLAVVISTVQGGTQALSRSLFTSLIPRHRTGEFFGFWGVLDKFGGALGPFVFASTVALLGSVRGGVLSVLAFFVVGFIVLTRVDVDAGRAAARAAEEGLIPAP